MITWTFSNRKDRSPTWYLVVTIIMLTLLIYGIITQLYIMSIVVFLFTGVFMYLENNSSDDTTVVVDDKKIAIGTSEYFWENFDSFTITELRGQAFFLRLFPKKKLATYIDIPFSEQTDVATLRAFLQSLMTENTNSELSQMDALIYASKI